MSLAPSPLLAPSGLLAPGVDADTGGGGVGDVFVADSLAGRSATQAGVVETPSGVYEEHFTVGAPEWFAVTLEPAKGAARLDVDQPLFDHVTITRRHPSGRVVTVRTANDAALSGGFYHGYDYELPIGRDVTYTATVTGPGDTTSMLSATVRWDTDETWLKDPAYPARNMVVGVSDPGDEGFEAPTGVFYVPGRPTPVTISEIRRAATGTLTLYADSLEESDALHLLTSSGHVLLFQTGPDYGVGSLYFALQQITSGRYSGLGTAPYRSWQLQYVETDAPVGDIVVGPETYQDVLDAYPTYADLLAGETTYLDLFEGINALVAGQRPTLAWRGA